MSNFASALIKGYGFDDGIYATLLQLPTGAFEAAIVPVCGLVATYVRDARCAAVLLCVDGAVCLLCGDYCVGWGYVSGDVGG